MGKIRWRHRLGSELTAAMFLSCLLGILLFLGMRSLTNFVWYQRAPDYNQYVKQQEYALKRLQGFLNQNRIRLIDTKKIKRWVDKERYISLWIYKDRKLLFTSYPLGSEKDTGLHDSDDSPGNYSYDTLVNRGDKLYTANFVDGTAQVFLMPNYEYFYYNLVEAVEGILSILVFIAVFLSLLRRKTAYIELLKNDLQILEGGDLSYEVTVKGSDELGELAEGIDRMRRSIIERDEEEKRMRKAGQEMVTAMSHDLRTPLTSLLGYLELLEKGGCEEEEQKKRFIHTGYQKALQIKEMSDRLFEYFLVYGKASEEIDLEEADAMELMGQTVCEEVYGLEEKGFTIEMELQEASCPLMVNINLFRRVVDNLFSNLVKYADPAQPIHILYGVEEGGVVMTVENGKNKSAGQVESSGIGLKTCSRIMKEHGGWFRTEEYNEMFRTVFYLPKAPF